MATSKESSSFSPSGERTRSEPSSVLERISSLSNETPSAHRDKTGFNPSFPPESNQDHDKNESTVGTSNLQANNNTKKKRKKAKSSVTKNNGKKRKTTGSGKVPVRFSLSIKIRKKRKKFPTVPGQFDDAMEEKTRSTIPATAATIDTSATKYHCSLASAVSSHHDRKMTVLKQFAVEYLKKMHHERQHRQLLESFEEQQQQLQQKTPAPGITLLEQQTATQANTGVNGSLSKEGTVELLQMQLLLKVLNAHIEYNQALLADATNNRPYQQQPKDHCTVDTHERGGI